MPKTVKRKVRLMVANADSRDVQQSSSRRVRGELHSLARTQARTERDGLASAPGLVEILGAAGGLAPAASRVFSSSQIEFATNREEGH